MAIRDLRAADASCGAKAHGLAKLAAAGLRVPDGFVIEAAVLASVVGEIGLGTRDGGDQREAPDGIGHALGALAERIAGAALPEALERDALARAEALGRVVVRSSASIEDGATGAAAGVFESVTDVRPADIWAAVRAVWTSALTPLAVAYARRREATIALAVIVQRFEPGARATVYTRPVGAPAADVLWLQRGDALERLARSEARDPDARAALAAEAAIGATGGADVELVHADEGAPWVVQARPIVHPSTRPAPRRAPPPIMLATLAADGRRWAWDVGHNPDPLSPAQAGLVEIVDRAGRVPYASRVCAGYLYTTARGERPRVDVPATAEALAQKLFEIEESIAIESGIARQEEVKVNVNDGGYVHGHVNLDGGVEGNAHVNEHVNEQSELAGAIAKYVVFVERWALELAPLIAAARARLPARLARDGVPAHELAMRTAALIGPRRVPRDRVMSPAWDVAVPTFAERDTAMRAAERALEAIETPAGLVDNPAPPSGGAASLGPAGLVDDVAFARVAADAAERDDVWFARAQWLVRRALLARSAELGLAEDDIFWLSLDDVLAATHVDRDDAHRRASAARAAHARAAAWDMPLVVEGETRTSLATGDALRGIGTGPRVTGRVVRFASLADAPIVRRGDVVVARAITPAMAMIVESCAALVSETGGLLDHGAAMARELGIPCVVGCAGAWSQLADGELVAIDGDGGTVTPLDAVATALASGAIA